MPEKPGASCYQEFLSGQAGELVPQIAADVFQIAVNDVLSVSQHVPPLDGKPLRRANFVLCVTSF
jgi:hypothetical protein